jgi:hypothetical protein
MARQPLRVAVLGDRHAPDELHHEIRVKRYFFPKYVSLIKREVRAEFESRGEDDSEN